MTYRETKYDVSISIASWPSEKYLVSVLEQVLYICRCVDILGLIMTLENVIFVIQKTTTTVIAINSLKFVLLATGSYVCFSMWFFLPSLIFKTKVGTIQFTWLNMQHNLNNFCNFTYEKNECYKFTNHFIFVKEARFFPISNYKWLVQ